MFLYTVQPKMIQVFSGLQQYDTPMIPKGRIGRPKAHMFTIVERRLVGIDKFNCMYLLAPNGGNSTMP